MRGVTQSRCDHAPQAGVAQGDLPWRSRQTSEADFRKKLEEGTGGEEVENEKHKGEERQLKRPRHKCACMDDMDDTQRRDLSHKCDVWTHVHQRTVRGVLRTAHCTRQCALWCPCHCSQCAQACSSCA